MEHTPIPSERRVLWPVVLSLCGIAIAVSIRRLIALADPSTAGPSPFAALDALFAANAGLTRGHALAGLALTLLIPVQLSARIRASVHRHPHRQSTAAGIPDDTTRRLRREHSDSG